MWDTEVKLKNKIIYNIKINTKINKINGKISGHLDLAGH